MLSSFLVEFSFSFFAPTTLFKPPTPTAILLATPFKLLARFLLSRVSILYETLLLLAHMCSGVLLTYLLRCLNLEPSQK